MSERSDGLKFGLGMHALGVAAALDAEGETAAAGAARALARTFLDPAQRCVFTREVLSGSLMGPVGRTSPARPAPSGPRVLPAARLELRERQLAQGQAR